MTTGEFHVDANAIRNETTDRIFVGVDGNNQPIFDEQTNVAAEAYGASAKYRHNLVSRYFAYGLGAWARILQAGIDDRWRGGGGFGAKLIEPQPHKLDVELGLEYNDESYVDGSSANFASLRAFVDYDYAISEHSTFSSDVELLQSLEDSDDLRINWPTSITASVSSKIALKLTYLVLYDHQPASLVVAPGPPPVLDVRKEFDGIFTTSIVVNW
jgi:putative salt-induced outer membrane protein YdiY